MKHYIDKDPLVAEIEKRYKHWREKEHSSHSIESEARMSECQHLLLLFNTLEVKEVDDPISKFKSLLHLHADMKSTCADGGYAPNLYFFDDSWHVDWISCTEGDSLIDFSDSTPEGAIQKAYDWFHSTFKNA